MLTFNVLCLSLANNEYQVIVVCKTKCLNIRLLQVRIETDENGCVQKLIDNIYKDLLIRPNVQTK